MFAIEYNRPTTKSGKKKVMLSVKKKHNNFLIEQLDTATRWVAPCKKCFGTTNTTIFAYI